jgi:long-chain acyl-CoA synthetase
VSTRTVIQVLEAAAAAYGDAPALRQPAGGGYFTLSWKQYLTAVTEIAAGLRSLGIGKGDVVALNATTRLEFYLADIGTMANGSIAAALYPSYPTKDLLHQIEQAGPCAIFVEDPTMLAALSGAPVRHWFLLTGSAEGALTLDQLRAKGREALAGDAQLEKRLNAELAPTDPAVLYLTSGATGEPKLALVTHQAIVANLEMGPVALPLRPDDATVAFLPSAHIAQRVVIEFLPIRFGMPVTFSESLLQLPGEIRKVRPTIMLAPPRMWERIYSTICTELRKRPAAAQKLFWGGLALGLAAARYRRQGKPVPARIGIPLKIADRLLFHKVRMRLGGRVRIAASGAAPLSKDLAEFYEAVGMPLVEGYGLTEGGVATLNPLDRPKAGSIGVPLPGVEIKFADDGEMLIKSPCLFSGYYNDPAGTAEVLREGWLHTGDVGHADEEGFIFITGRKKELIVSSTGKKIYPSRVEAMFKMEPLISHVLLIGDRLPFLTAIFTLNLTVAESLKGIEQWKGRPAAELAAAPPVTAAIQKAVSRVNKQLAPFEQVRKYRVLARDFSIEAGELTATMKLRRSRALENCREEIAELYAGRE